MSQTSTTKQRREPQSVRDSARGKPCAVRLPGVCSFDPETTVYAHISGVRFGHGTGIKTRFGAYCCHACHEVVDNRVETPEGLTQTEVRLFFYEGVFDTLNQLLGMGLLKYG